MSSHRPAERASALFLVLVVTMTILAILGALFSITLSASQESAVRVDYAMALEVPEAGLNVALRDIQNCTVERTGDEYIGFVEQNLDAGSFDERTLWGTVNGQDYLVKLRSAYRAHHVDNPAPAVATFLRSINKADREDLSDLGLTKPFDYYHAYAYNTRFKRDASGNLLNASGDIVTTSNGPPAEIPYGEHRHGRGIGAHEMRRGVEAVVEVRKIRIELAIPAPLYIDGDPKPAWNGSSWRVSGYDHKMPGVSNCTTCGGDGIVTTVIPGTSCATCGGDGIVTTMTGGTTCLNCGGAGTITSTTPITVCTACSGTGSITTYTSTAKCDTCNGKGWNTCPKTITPPAGPCTACGGKGYFTPCATCNGDGIMAVACATCGGCGRLLKNGGQVPGGMCATCGNTGQAEITCTGCEGVGRVLNNGNPIPGGVCTTCNNTGFDSKGKACNKCKVHATCGGTGKVTGACPTCMICTAVGCNGDGLIDQTCTVCNGSGKGEPTSDTNGIICSVCNGTGTMTGDPITCPICNGSGKATCTACGGDGQVDANPVTNPCATCGGDGQVGGETSTSACVVCGGAGMTGGTVTNNPCADCGGLGSVGATSTDTVCTVCGGTGKIATAPTFDEDKLLKVAHTTDGKGNITITLDADGKPVSANANDPAYNKPGVGYPGTWDQLSQTLGKDVTQISGVSPTTGMAGSGKDSMSQTKLDLRSLASMFVGGPPSSPLLSPTFDASVNSDPDSIYIYFGSGGLQEGPASRAGPSHLGDQNTFYITYVRGDGGTVAGHMTGGGVLVVDGSLHISGLFTWYGIVIVLGDLTLSGGGQGKHIFGAILGAELKADGTQCESAVSGQSDIWWCQDAIDKVMRDLRPNLTIYPIIRAWRSLDKAEVTTLP